MFVSDSSIVEIISNREGGREYYFNILNNLINSHIVNLLTTTRNVRVVFMVCNIYCTLKHIQQFFFVLGFEYGPMINKIARLFLHSDLSAPKNSLKNDIPKMLREIFATEDFFHSICNEVTWARK